MVKILVLGVELLKLELESDMINKAEEKKKLGKRNMASVSKERYASDDDFEQGKVTSVKSIAGEIGEI